MCEDTQVPAPKDSREAATRSPGTGEFLGGCALTSLLGIVGAFLGLLFHIWRDPPPPPGACGLYVIGLMAKGSIIGGPAGFMLGLFLVWRYEAHYYPSRATRSAHK